MAFANRLFGAAWLLASMVACGGDSVVTPTQDAAPNDGATTDATADSSPIVDAAADALADSPTDSPADAGFNLGTVPGLVLWLDGSKGVTADGNGKVSKWADQSGNGNDAVQATSAVQPTAVAQGINNKPSIRFTTNPNSSPFPHLSVPDAASLRFGTADFFIAAVAKWSNTSSFGMIVSKQAVASPFAGYAYYMSFPTAGKAGGQLDANTNVGSTLANLNDNTPRQFAFARSGGTASIRINGVSDGTLSNTSVNSDAMGVPLSIGGLAGSNGLHPLQGDIAELVIVSGNLTSGNRDAIEAYLKAKYGL